MTTVFSKRDVIPSATEIVFPSVCMSVCLLHALALSKQTIYSRICLGCTAWTEIWLGCKKTVQNICNRFSQGGGCSVKGNTKKSWYSTNISLYLGNDTRQGHSYSGRWIVTRVIYTMVPTILSIPNFNVTTAQDRVYDIEWFVRRQTDKKSYVI